MIRPLTILIFLFATIFATAYQMANAQIENASEIPESVIYTLYTNAPSDPNFRTKIATFDYFVGKDFEDVDASLNQKRCDEVAVLLQWKWKQDTKNVASQPGVNKVRHWCEKGRFKIKGPQNQ